MIPGHFKDPLGLAGRVWRQGGVHGRYSLLYAGLSLGAKPFDYLLRSAEHRSRTRFGGSDGPMVVVCGAPRSGTTVMAELLAIAARASYITNLMSMFPHSPIAASRLFRVYPNPNAVPLSSHYGRTAGLAAPNDGLTLWDRWLGPDRTKPDPSRLALAAADVREFFSTLSRWTGRPVVTKNNALNLIAAEVARTLPNARLVVMEREPVYLAQSLLLARRYIHNDPGEPYGVRQDDRVHGDPVRDVARQVRFHQELAEAAQSHLGPQRLSVIGYEDLCSDPRAAVSAVLEEAGIPATGLEDLPRSLQVSKRMTLEPDVMDQLESLLAT